MLAVTCLSVICWSLVTDAQTTTEETVTDAQKIQDEPKDASNPTESDRLKEQYLASFLGKYLLCSCFLSDGTCLRVQSKG